LSDRGIAVCVDTGTIYNQSHWEVDVHPNRYAGKRDVLVRQIRDAIFRGELIVGERLRQDDLAARFEVSSTPVREALRVLETQGLVTHEPNRGVTVANVAGRFEQVYRLREALECLAVEMAGENMTPKRAAELISLAALIEAAGAAGDETARHDAHTNFHLSLYSGCDFPALVDMIQAVWVRFPWDELLALPGLRTSLDHHEIAVLAASGDGPAAAARLRDHLHSVRDALAAVVAARSDGELVNGKEPGAT